MVRIKQYTGLKKQAKATTRAKKLERVHKMLQICLPGNKTVVGKRPCTRAIKTEVMESAWSSVEREEDDDDARARKWTATWDNARRVEAERLEKHRQRGQELKQAV